MKKEKLDNEDNMMEEKERSRKLYYKGLSR